MKSKNLFLFGLFLLSNFSVFSQDVKIKSVAPLVIGEIVELHSQILDEKRTLNIYLPNGYHKDSVKTYPVIYLLDGSIDEDFIHISGLVQFGSFSWINLLPESIVVGIANVDRRRDFTYPTTIKKDKEEFPTAGKSEKFIAFIEKELQPLINKDYNVKSTKTLIGQSLGGLLATEILFKKPDLFDNYIIVSPSLWWDKQSLLKAETANYKSKKSIFISVGQEGLVMEKDAKALFSKLEAKKDNSTNLFFKYFKRQSHGDALHLSVYSAFEELFKPIKN